MEKYIESITALEIEITGTQIRVWRQEPWFSEQTSENTKKELDLALTQHLKKKGKMGRKEIADFLFMIDRVNAVEVKNADGSGIVLYKDWP